MALASVPVGELAGLEAEAPLEVAAAPRLVQEEPPRVVALTEWVALPDRAALPGAAAVG